MKYNDTKPTVWARNPDDRFFFLNPGIIFLCENVKVRRLYDAEGMEKF